MNPRQEPLARQATPAATAHRQDARLRRFLVGHVLGKRTPWEHAVAGTLVDRTLPGTIASSVRLTEFVTVIGAVYA